MRFLGAIAKGLWKRHVLSLKSSSDTGGFNGITAPHVYRARCTAFDADLNLHLNNASLILRSEFARWNWIAESGLLPEVAKRRWLFFIGSQAVRYRHEIRLFRAFHIETQIVAIDDRWIWTRQMFYVYDDNTESDRKASTSRRETRAESGAEGGGGRGARPPPALAPTRRCAAEVLVRVTIKDGARQTVSPRRVLKELFPHLDPKVTDELVARDPSRVDEIGAFLAWDEASRRIMEAGERGL